MDYETRRRIVHGVLTLVLGTLATWLATQITNKLIGVPPDELAAR